MWYYPKMPFIIWFFLVRQVLQQVSALVPLASTLTHLSLYPVHHWEGRPVTYSEETLMALRQLTRYMLAAVVVQSCT